MYYNYLYITTEILYYDKWRALMNAAIFYMGLTLLKPSFLKYEIFLLELHTLIDRIVWNLDCRGGLCQ